MARTKGKRKTAVMTLRVSPAVKAAAKRVADHDRRSVTNMVEVLIMDRLKALKTDTMKYAPKETP